MCERILTSILVSNKKGNAFEESQQTKMFLLKYEEQIFFAENRKKTTIFKAVVNLQHDRSVRHDPF